MSVSKTLVKYTKYFFYKQTAKNMLILNYMKCSVKLLRKLKNRSTYSV